MKTSSKQELVLSLFIVLEIALFSVTGKNFFSLNNLFECIRLGVEVGLLALALTPVIVTGGIDLSVGSMMGLCAVSFGALWQDAHLPVVLAVFLTLVVSVLGGAVNATLIARLGVSPLIVTLGTYSLFRGLAEAITVGARNYSGFPAGFLYVGQGYLGGRVPTQMIFLVLAVVGFWALLHRTVIGRGLYAIGHSAAAARYAAVPITRRIALVYLLSGFASGVAAITYVAHLGQAKSDAGLGYELIAITAVVLGGTSIFGGSGTIAGTLLGLAAIVILQNGLRLSEWPTELAGILTGILLVATITLERVVNRPESTAAAPETSQRYASRKRRLAILYAIVLLAVVIPLSQRFLGGFRTTRANGSSATGNQADFTIAVMPKAKGDPFFISCRIGAEQAARDFNVDLIWDGPTGLDAAKQNEIIEGWITRHVDAISVSVENGPGISSVLRKARAEGIKVVTWDADAEPDARDYFINQATPKSIGDTLIDETARVMGDRGQFAIITGALSAANQNLWISFMKRRVQEKHPDLNLVAIRPSDDDRDKAFNETQTLLKVYPQIKVIAAISAPAVPGAGEAVKQSGRRDVQVIGLSLPNLCKPYVHDGEIEAVVLWNTKDLGYLAVAAPAALARGIFPVGRSTFDAGRLGRLQVEGKDVILGKPLIFRKNNIDNFDF